MSNKKFFPPRPEANPTFYAYELVGVSLMNNAVYKFKRYEDSSLTYTGISNIRTMAYDSTTLF